MDFLRFSSSLPQIAYIYNVYMFSAKNPKCRNVPFEGSPDKPGGLSIQPCKSEKEEPYIRHSSQGRSECLYLRIE